MPRTKARKKTTTKSKGSVLYQTGFDLGSLSARLNQGTGDEEMLFMADGDQIQIAVVSPIKQWVTFYQHYIGRNKGYVICTGDGCLPCDEGSYPSTRVLIGVYVKAQYRAARGDFKASKSANVGHKYMMLNKETAEGFARKAKRRRGRLDDAIYYIERDGADTSTKYDVERTNSKPTRNMLNWPEMDIPGKLEQIAERDMAKIAGGGGSSRKRRDDDDDDFDFSDDLDDFGASKKKRRGTKRRRRQ